MKKRTIALVLVTAGLAVAVWHPPIASAAKRRATAVTYCPANGFIAHRGEDWPGINSSDSSLAVQAGIDDPGAAGVESDVWATSDGLGVMQHSNSLAESTPTSGLVSDRTLDDLQDNVPMDDMTQIQSLRQYLHQMVANRKHGILHVKDASLDGYVDSQLTAAGAHSYIRPMAVTFAEAQFFVDHGWITELALSGIATATRVAQAKAMGISILVVDDSRNVTPSSWIQPYIDAGVSTDYVTYSAAQDGLISQYKFARVLSGDIAVSRQISGCS